MVSDGYIAFILFFLHPWSGIFYLLAVIANVLDADYKGYFVMGMVIFSVINRIIEISGVSRR